MPNHLITLRDASHPERAVDIGFQSSGVPDKIVITTGEKSKEGASPSHKYDFSVFWVARRQIPVEGNCLLKNNHLVDFVLLVLEYLPRCTHHGMADQLKFIHGAHPRASS